MAFFEIGIYAPVHSENIGTLWRSAFQLGASGVFIIGKYRRSQASDTAKTFQQIPFRIFPTWNDFLTHRPVGTRIIGVEMGGSPLSEFSHPSEALYVLGSEANGLPEYVMKECDFIVTVESLRYASYNVAVTGSLVMYHRQIIFTNPK